MYETYIFDLDGTLLDTLDDLTDAVNATLRKYNLNERTIEEVRAFVGDGLKMLLRRSVGGDRADLDEMLIELKEYYREHCEDKTKPYDGVIPLLQTLKRQGKKIAIVSNKADFAVKRLAKTYFQGLIDVAIGENEERGIRKKPAPDSVFSAMKILNAEPSSTVYVGDSDVDVKTAKNAYLPCISVTWGFRDEKFLRESGGEIFAFQPSDIEKL